MTFEELKELSDNLPGFHYIPTLSREQWDGANGYVHAVYENILQSNPNPAATFMLCGWKAMIDEAKIKIVAMGYDKKQIHFELYENQIRIPRRRRLETLSQNFGNRIIEILHDLLQK